MKDNINNHDSNIQDMVNQLYDLLKDNIKSNDCKLLTRDETCRYLQINPTTLYHWTNEGKLTSYGIGKRIYYKKNEVIESLTKIGKEIN